MNAPEPEMDTASAQIKVTRVFAAPRQLVFSAFTDPDQLSSWWGPAGREIPPEYMELDLRPGGFGRWVEVDASDPDLRIDVRIDVVDFEVGESLEGILRVGGELSEGIEPFSSRFRVELRDESDGHTRLEIWQWLPDHLTRPAEQGWQQALDKLDTTLRRPRLDRVEA